MLVLNLKFVNDVAPFTGAWIEILGVPCCWMSFSVAPFTGAWIEIAATMGKLRDAARRSLHGSVD